MKKKVVVMMLTMMMVMSVFTGCESTKQNQDPSTVVETQDGKDQSKEQEDPEQKPEKQVKESIVEKYAAKQKDNPQYDDNVVYEAECVEEAVVNTAPAATQNFSGVSKVETRNPYEMIEEIPFNTEEYAALMENGFSSVALSPLSTFSADVDTASYSNVRRMINQGYMLENIPKGAVRTEEFLNYFNYDYKTPENGEPFGVTTEISNCPWNENSKLLRIGLQTEAIDFSDAPASNIVFLIDVSGSMNDPNKLPLLKKSFKLMLDELDEKDTVSIVTYAGTDKVVLEGVPASEKQTICDALDQLEAYGGTNGGQGIISAYRLAEANFLENGNNRVILATDGDMNIGITSQSDLTDLIKEESESGIYLTILGFGMGNYSDARLESIADNGNGNYAYIDNMTEAKKVLSEELGANMYTVAKDVKLQVEFNPAVVSSYRLIGYEDRILNAEDFKNDAKDAGEIGAGHSVTALYEIVTVDAQTGNNEDELKYQTSVLSDAALNSDEWLTLSIRYKEPKEDTSKLLEYPVGQSSYTENASEDFKFASYVAMTAQILRGEDFVAGYTINDAYNGLSQLDMSDSYREEFMYLVKRLSDSNE